MSRHPIKLFLIAGEHSGDALGERLMMALKDGSDARIKFAGVGGPGMERQGLASLFPLADIAVMGIPAIVRRFPRIAQRAYQTIFAAVAYKPDAVVIIDSPEFTHPIAKRIRRKLPSVPIINYVSPSVWAWRPGRAARMRSYVDHVLALLPFEPEAHKRLGGPDCTYVGHPLSERMPALRSLDPSPLSSRLNLNPARPVLVVLPGSRRSEVGRLMQPFGDAIGELLGCGIEPTVIVPVVSHVRPQIEAGIENWLVRPHLVEGEDNRFMAFRLADAALAASGTVTLELAVCGTPAVVAYKVDRLMAPFLRRILPRNTPSVVLANLVAGKNVYPEFLQENCTGRRLSAALQPLLFDSAERRAQIEGLEKIPERLAIPQGTPSSRAAKIVLSYAVQGRRKEKREMKVDGTRLVSSTQSLYMRSAGVQQSS